METKTTGASMTPSEISRIEGRLIELLERMASVETTLASMAERRKEEKHEEWLYREKLDAANERRHTKDDKSITQLEVADEGLLGFNNKIIGGMLLMTLGLSATAAAIAIFQAIGW